MRVVKWGNSLAIRLPSAVVRALDLKAGDDIEIRAAGGRTIDLSRKPSRAELVQRLRMLPTRLPVDFRFDRDDANVR